MNSVSHKGYFEDFNVGDRVITPARTITEADVALFSVFTGGWRGGQSDAASPEGTPPGEQVAQSLMTLTISGGLLFLAGNRGVPRSTIALGGVEQVLFGPRVKIGDTIHVEGEVAQVTEIDRQRGLIAMRHHVKNQHGEEILSYVGKILAGRRPSSGEACDG